MRFGGEVRGFDVDAVHHAKEARRMDPFMHYGVAAGMQAVGGFGHRFHQDRSRRAVARSAAPASAGSGPSRTSTTKYLKASNSPRKISPFFVPASIINMISGHLSIKYNLKGPNLGVVTACTTSTHAIGLGMRTIQYGDADVMIAGGGEMATTVCGLGSFGQAKALSTRNDAPAKASRPWDRDRDGFVLGDGGGAVVLEEFEHAKKRGARIYAELVGFGMSGDAHHITAPPEDGEGARLAMANALQDARMNPSDMQYVNAHATSTPLGRQGGNPRDEARLRRSREEAGRQLDQVHDRSPAGRGRRGRGDLLDSSRSATTWRRRPSTTRRPDPDCDLDYVPNTARKMQIDVALSNSFGFGGTNGTVIFRRFKD